MLFFAGGNTHARLVRGDSSEEATRLVTNS
jgi:hypothetical protein